MPSLPDSDISLAGRIIPQRQPSRTWRINKSANRIEGESNDLAAVRQAAEIILNTERFRWEIYQPYSGVEWSGLIGEDPGYVGANLLRRIRQALLVDDRILGVTDFDFSVQDDQITASMTLNTVYGDFSLQFVPSQGG